MKSYWTFHRTKLTLALLASAAVLTGPAIADNLAFAENIDEVAAMDQGTFLIEPSETHPGYMLPPLSDHLNIAQLNGDQSALEDNDDEAALEEHDGTAKEYNRGYYAEPVQVVELVLVPTTIEAIELSNVSDDGTARQYDRGYYKEPEIFVALVIVLSEEIEQ
jgi:hypothetical protein